MSPSAYSNYLFKSANVAASGGNVIHRENWPRARARSAAFPLRQAASIGRADGSSWPALESWVRRVVWAAVVIACAVDLAVTFGPHLAVH